MAHGAAEVDLDAGMNGKTLTVRTGEHHHIDTERTSVGVRGLRRDVRCEDIGQGGYQFLSNINKI